VCKHGAERNLGRYLQSREGSPTLSGTRHKTWAREIPSKCCKTWAGEILSGTRHKTWAREIQPKILLRFGACNMDLGFACPEEESKGDRKARVVSEADT
jgi:hypothetical protein